MEKIIFKLLFFFDKGCFWYKRFVIIFMRCVIICKGGGHGV